MPESMQRVTSSDSTLAVSATIGQYFWVQAFKAGEMSAVAPFEYLRLPFAVFMGWLIWSEMPVVWTYVGAAIVKIGRAHV